MIWSSACSYSVQCLVQSYHCLLYCHLTGWVVGFCLFSPDDGMVECLFTLCSFVLQVDRTGNCLFCAIKKSLLMRTATSQKATFFPNWYFRRMVVNYMVNHCQLIFYNRFLALMSLYGVEERADLDRGWNSPLSFKEYLRLLLSRDFWGD